MRQAEALARGADELAAELVLVGEGHGMDEDVQPPIGVPPAREDPLDILVALHVAGLHEGGAQLPGERADPLLDEHLHGREAHGRSLAVERPGDAPCDGVVVGQPEDQCALALQQTHQLHPSLRRRGRRRAPSVSPARKDAPSARNASSRASRPAWSGSGVPGVELPTVEDPAGSRSPDEGVVLEGRPEAPACRHDRGATRSGDARKPRRWSLDRTRRAITGPAATFPGARAPVRIP